LSSGRELRHQPGEKFDGDKIENPNSGFKTSITLKTLLMIPSRLRPRTAKTWSPRQRKRTANFLSARYQFRGPLCRVRRNFQKNFDLFNWPRFTGGGQSLSLLRASVPSAAIMI